MKLNTRAVRTALIALAVGAVALIGFDPLSAQPTPPATTTSTTGPSEGTTVVFPNRTTRPATPLITMRFENASLDAVLNHLSEAAGFIIVKDKSLADHPITARVNILAIQPVTPEEAVSLLNTALNPDHVAVRTGRFLKVSTHDEGKGATPVTIGSDPATIAETDDLITQIVPIHSLDAVKLKADLQPFISPRADVSSNALGNSLIVTDTAAHVRRLVTIISKLDAKQSEDTDILVKQLKYADAATAVKLIQDIFKSSDQGQGQQQQNQFRPPWMQGGGRGFGGGGGGGQDGESGSNEKGRTVQVTASSDSRTNTIVVTGPKDTLKLIDDQILSKLDNNPVVAQAFFTYHVKNGNAVDIQNTLNNLFGGNNTSSQTSRTSTGTNTSTGNRVASGFGNSGGSSGFGGGGGGSSGLGGSSSSGVGNSLGGNNRSRTTGGNTGTGTGRTSTAGSTAGRTTGGSSLSGISADLVGQVQVVADADTNTLLVVTATQLEGEVRKIINDLDRPVPQVLIKVLIAEVTHNRSDDLGVDFSVLNLRAGNNGQSIGTNLGNIASAQVNGGLAVSVLESNLTATFHALAVAGKIDVLSRPYILTSDNQEANILVGQVVPFISASRVTDTGQTINTIQYQNVGIILDVTPHINPEGLVVMDVAPQISSTADTTVQIQPGVKRHGFNQRSAQSRVNVRDGDTIVIGGLMQDQKLQTVTKIPIIGDIPILGLLFQRDNVVKTKTELLIFLTPHVAAAPEALNAAAADEMKGIHLTPGAVQPGTFQEQLKGMRLGGATTQPALPIPPAERQRGWWEPEPRMP